MTFTERVVSGTLDLMSAAVCLFLLTGYLSSIQKRTQAEVAFMCLLGLLIINGLSLGAALLMEHMYGAFILANISNILMPLAYAFYIIFKIRETEPVSNALFYLAIPISALALILFIVPFVHQFDNAVQYESIMVTVVVAMDMIILIRHSRGLGLHKSIVLMNVSVLPFLVPYLMSRITGARLRLPVITLTVLMVYVRIHVRDEQRMEEQDRELTDSRMALMMSQIRPHFLYNTLSTIYYLCEKDPLTAQRAVGEFTSFLRTNLEAIEHEQQVPFSRELETLKNYLSLEALRYGKRLSVEYDIASEDFLLPALSVQPLVENAVRHGIAPKKGGGTVLIRSREEANAYIVEVLDNGIGLEESAKHGKEHVGIGLKNVSERLRTLCGGSLEVTPRTDEPGTLARIVLPKKKKNAMRTGWKGENHIGPGKMDTESGNT